MDLLSNTDGLEITECEFESQSMYTVFAIVACRISQWQDHPAKQTCSFHLPFLFSNHLHPLFALPAANFPEFFSDASDMQHTAAG